MRRRQQRNHQAGFLSPYTNTVGQFSMTDEHQSHGHYPKLSKSKTVSPFPKSWLIRSLSHPPTPMVPPLFTLLITLSSFLSLISSLSLPLRSFSSFFFFNHSPLAVHFLDQSLINSFPNHHTYLVDEDLRPSCFLTPVCSISWVFTLTTPNPALLLKDAIWLYCIYYTKIKRSF